MSPRKTEEESAIRHPRETAELFGHREAEAALLDAYRSGRIPHAWLIGGAAGDRQGDAGLSDGALRAGASQSALRRRCSAPRRSRLIASDPVARQIAADAHGGLLVLERGLNDRGVMRTVITVDETRETISFFGSTAAVEGWRVCIVDTVDELNPNAANALLKILEEPPQQSLFLLVSHATVAGVADHFVTLPQTAAAAACDRRRRSAPRPRASDRPADDPALVEAAAASEGSVARALTLLGGDALKLQQRTAALLATLPRVDPRELHALGDALGISDRVALAAFIDGIERWVSGAPARGRGQCQCEPAAPCTAGGGMGKDRPRRARYRRVQSGAKTAGFLGVFAARGSDALSR